MKLQQEACKLLRGLGVRKKYNQTKIHMYEVA